MSLFISGDELLVLIGLLWAYRT